MPNYVSKMTVGGSTALIKDSEARDLISENTANIAKNANNISNNIAKNANNISNNTANIAKNTANISKNTTNISNNMANISENTANISTMNNEIRRLNSHVNNKSNPHNVTAEQLGVTKSNIVNMIYPIGSIYMSVNNADPATLFGGKWTRLEDRFLVGAGNSYTVNATGGETKHSHKYGVTYNAYFGGVVGNDETLIRTVDYPTNTTNNAVKAVTNVPVDVNVNDTASRKTVNGYIMTTEAMVSEATAIPPYLAVYMWKRVE